MTRAVLLLAAVVLVFALAGCGNSGKLPGPGAKKATTVTKKRKPPAEPPAGNVPIILRFDGPGSVRCTRKGQRRTVIFRYRTRRATAVEPSVDGQAIGAQAGYNPKQGRMRFPYKCPGPHTVTITATNNLGHSASRSVGVSPAGPS
jgi:predicted small lipoprotein YifL